jgi:hypothetical protein
LLSGATFTTLPAQPTSALTTSYVDVPGLTTTVATTGLYQISASVNVQNTSASAGTEVGVRLVVNGQPLDSRVLSFAPSSPTYQQSIDVEADQALTAGEFVEVQAAALGSSGSAQYPGSTQDLRLIQFNDLSGPSPGATFTTVPSQPSDAVANAYADVPGLTATVAAAGSYHLSASVNLQNTAASSGTEVGVQLVANGQVLDSRVISFAPNSRTFQQSVTVEADEVLSAGEFVEVQAAALGSSGSAQYPGSTQDLRLIQFIAPPDVTNPGSQSSPEGAPIQLAIMAVGADSFAATGLPPGLSIDPTSGLISGTIGAFAAGVYTVTVTGTSLSDPGHPATAVNFAWTVNDTTAPALTNPGNQSGAEGGTVHLPISAIDADRFSASGLPPGLSIDAGTGLIEGTIGINGAGTYDVTVTAMDSDSTDSSTSVSFTWTVIATDTAPTFPLAVGDMTVTVGQSVTVAVNATEPDGESVTYSLDPGAPAGAAIDPHSGVFTWTPTAAGDATITVRASNGRIPAESATETFRIHVQPEPVIVSAGAANLRKGSLTGIVVTLSGPIDAGSAQDVSHYRLTFTSGKGKRARARNVPVGTVVYNAEAGTITVQPRGKISAGKRYELVISGLADTTGRLVEGGTIVATVSGRQVTI